MFGGGGGGGVVDTSHGMMYNYRRANLGKNYFHSFNLSFSN